MKKSLQNPVWYSLNETHVKWLIEYNGVRFYDPDVCPFGAFEDVNKTSDALNEYAKLTEKFFLVTESDEPICDEVNVTLLRKFDGCQMVLDELVPFKITEEIIYLTEDYVDEIYELIWLVMPGYYRCRSYEMGNYYGIKKDGRLVAIAGQRMQTDAFVEVSGVVTHPDYTRRGYAGQLVTYCTQQIIKQGKHPILHTTVGNQAIKLYERMGYRLTRRMNWWHFGRK